MGILREDSANKTVSPNPAPGGLTKARRVSARVRTGARPAGKAQRETLRARARSKGKKVFPAGPAAI